MRPAKKRTRTGSLKLVVGIDDPDYKTNPEGFCSSDSIDWLVAPFCKKYHIPYEREFVSISVRSETKLRLASSLAGKVKIAQAADLYGVGFVLKQEVIDEISVVSDGDFQTLVGRATVRMIASKSIKRCLKQFRKVVGSRRERVKLLRTAIENVNERNGYAEARLFRPLKRSDCVDPDAGIREVLADNLLGSDQ